MRKVTAGLFITLDGITEEPNSWQETFDDDIAAAMNASMADVDTILLGRGTYQDWEPYWPKSTDEPFASFINNTPKVVVSTTLDEVKWGEFANAQLAKGNFAEEIAKLKAQPGKTISVMGSPSLVNSLLQHGLLDELKLIIYNVVVYKGERLFKDGNLKRLDLLDAKATRTGVIIATYQPRT